MNLGYSILYVESVPDTIAFYERAFGLKRRVVTDTGEYGELDTGETTLAFGANGFVKGLSGIPLEPAALDKAAPPVELGLVTDVDKVDATYERAVSAGAVAVKPPERKPWGQLVGYVRDDNGFLIEICSPVAS